MALRKPILPPKAGYVEKVDKNGNHIYVPTPETAAKLRRQQENADLQTFLNTILGVNESNDEQTASGS